MKWQRDCDLGGWGGGGVEIAGTDGNDVIYVVNICDVWRCALRLRYTLVRLYRTVRMFAAFANTWRVTVSGVS